MISRTSNCSHNIYDDNIYLKSLIYLNIEFRIEIKLKTAVFKLILLQFSFIVPQDDNSWDPARGLTVEVLKCFETGE